MTMHLTTRIAAALLAALLAFAPITADAADPSGIWQSASGESRYAISLCGDGTELCARLTWLRDDVRTDENLVYLNKLVVNRATLAADNRWQGELTYDGDTFSGSVTLEDEDSLNLQGCKGIFCQSLRFRRL